MSQPNRYDMVLAIYPSTHGIAFVLFEGALSPVDWGVREVLGRHKNQRSLLSVSAVLDRYRPDVLVLQDMSSIGTRRARRIRELNAEIAELADERGVPVFTYSRTQVREAFEPTGFATKHLIAERIAKNIPAFERYMPPVRKPWMNEHRHMSLFDAAALALTFFQHQGGDETAP